MFVFNEVAYLYMRCTMDNDGSLFDKTSKYMF